METIQSIVEDVVRNATRMNSAKMDNASLIRV